MSNQKFVFSCEKKPELAIVYRADQTMSVQERGRMRTVRQSAEYISFIKGFYETSDPEQAEYVRSHEFFRKGIIVEAKAGAPKVFSKGPKLSQGHQNAGEVKAGPAPDETAREVGAAHIPDLAAAPEDADVTEAPVPAPKPGKKAAKKPGKKAVAA